MLRLYQKKRAKLGNHSVKADGETFDSHREYHRWCELQMLHRCGRITDLRRQVPFELIPAQYEDRPTGEYYQRGKRAGEPKFKRVCIEQSCVYIADFTYNENGVLVVEDAKGYRDPSSAAYAKFVIKRKLMLYVHHIKIKEV